MIDGENGNTLLAAYPAARNVCGYTEYAIQATARLPRLCASRRRLRENYTVLIRLLAQISTSLM